MRKNHSKKPRQVIILPPEAEENCSQAAEIDELMKQFRSLAKIHKNLKLEDNVLSLADKEFRLNQYVTTFQKKTVKANTLIEQIMMHYRNRIDHHAYHHSLVKEITEAVLQLQKLATQRTSLQNAILQRFAQVFPDTNNSEELQVHRELAAEALQKQLDKFFPSIFILRIGNKKDPTSIKLTKELINFLNDTFLLLKDKTTGLNMETVKTLERSVYAHLGVKSWFMKTAASQNTSELIANLFYWQGQESIVTLKKQLVALHHLNTKIAAFPLHAIKEFDMLSQLTEQNEQTIKAHALKLPAELSEFSRDLNERLRFFSSEDSEKPIIAKARTKRPLLNEWLNQVDAILATYQQQCSQLAPSLSALERLQSICEQQEICIQALQNIERLMEQYRPEHSMLKQKLSLEYESQKKMLFHKLSQSIQETNQALLLIRDKVTVDFELSEARSFCEKILQQQQPLYALRMHADYIANKLEKQVSAVKQLIKNKWQPDLQQLYEAYYTPHSGYTQYSKTNPCQPLLEQHYLAMARQKRSLDKHWRKLETTGGAEIRAWLGNLQSHRDELYYDIQYRNSLERQAKIIQQRLEHPTYQASIKIINALDKEIIRLLQKYSPKMRNFCNEEEQSMLADITQNPDLCLEKKEFSDDENIMYDKIDRRIMKLINIRLLFIKENNSYISINPHLTDPRQYREALIKHVNDHLHNGNMEHYSDGTRHSFTQWIRTYVLRPLQTTAIGTYDYFAKRDNKHQFFYATPGASSTEKNLIALGNEMSSELASTAPAA